MPQNEYASQKVVKVLPQEQQQEQEQEQEGEITTGIAGTAAGTACTMCSDEHLSRASGALAEAMRFARTTGMKDSEVIRRVRAARDELNEMERFDLAPDTVAKLPGREKEIANWALSQSRDLRHEINSLISGGVGDLERVAAHSIEISNEFMQKLWEMPEEECPTCAVNLKQRIAELKANRNPL